MKASLPLLAAVSLGLISTAPAAEVTFGTATTESADSDIRTDGTLAYAYSFDQNGFSPTINGVTFAGQVSANSNGNYSTSNFADSYNGFGSNAAPFANLSASYQALLYGAIYAGGASPFTLQNLTIGDTYLVQFFINDSRSNGNPNGTEYFVTGANRDDQVALSFNSTGGEGGVGQFITGAFTADATSQVFSIEGGGTLDLSGFELRITVPEPITYPSLCLGGIFLVMAGRRLMA